MSNIAAGFMTLVTAIFVAVLTVTTLTASLGAKDIEAPLLWTILVTNIATQLVAWVTARTSTPSVSLALSFADRQRGVAAFVFTNAATAVVTLATNAMESWELGFPSNHNALTIILQPRISHEPTFLFVYLICVSILAVVSLSLTVFGARMFAPGRAFDDATTQWLSGASIVLMVIAVSIGVSWKSVGMNAEPLMGAWAIVSQVLLTLMFAGFVMLQAYLLYWSARLFASTAARGVVSAGKAIMARSKLLLGGTIVWEILKGVAIGAGVGWLATELVKGVFRILRSAAPNHPLLSGLPFTAQSLLDQSLQATLPLLLGTAFVCALFLVWTPLVRWVASLPDAWGEFSANVERAVAGAVSFIRGIRDWWNANENRRTTFARSLRMAAYVGLLPVQVLLIWAAAFVDTVFHRRVLDVLLAAGIVFLPMHTARQDAPPPPTAPPPPSTPPLEDFAPIPKPLCELSAGRFDWVIGSADKFEIDLQACQLPRSYGDERGVLVVFGAASLGEDQPKETARAFSRGAAMANWASVRVPAGMRVYMVNLGMATRETSFRRAAYLFGSGSSERPAPSVLLSSIPREAEPTDGDVVSKLPEIMRLIDAPRNFTTCELYAYDLSAAQTSFLRQIEGFTCTQ